MSRRDSDSEKVPAALYDRLTDTPTYAARMYKVQKSLHNLIEAIPERDSPEPIPSAGPAPNGKNRPVVTPVTSITEPLTVTVKASVCGVDA